MNGLLIDPQAKQRFLAMKQHEFENREFSLFSLLVLEEYKQARIEQRKAGKDAKLSLNVVLPLQIANMAVARFTDLHTEQPEPDTAAEESAAALRKEVEAKQEPAAATQPAGGIVLP